MYGQDAKIGISFQNSYGTANVASLHWLEPISESVSLSKAQLTQKGMRGSFDKGQSQEGINTVGGDITIEAKANALGVLLSAVNASPVTSTTGVSSGTYFQHTFKPRQADHNLLCAERPFTFLKYLGDVGSAHQYYDLNGNNLELNIANGELLTAKMSIVGGSYARIASVAAAYSASNAIDWSVSSVSFAGVANTGIRSMTISQELALQAQNTIDIKKFPSRIKRTDSRMVNISGTLIFEDQGEYNQFLNQVDQQVVINLKGTSQVSSGFYEALTIDIPSMRYTEFPIAVGGPGQLEISFKATAQYNIGSATTIAYTLACGKAGF